MYQSSVLLIDSNVDTLNTLSDCFQQEGAHVKKFQNAVSAYDYLKTNKNTDVVLTDWIMPMLDGLELCKLIKRSTELSHIPVVMITDRNSEIDAVTALEVGAEDYIRKPILVRELVTRVKKILQRQRDYTPNNIPSNPSTPNGQKNSNGKDIIRQNGIMIDTYQHKAFLKDKELKLTYSEFKLLELFITNPGRVYQRSTLIEKINGIDYYATERSVDVMIVGLRKKLGEFKKFLETVRGVGYRFNERE